MVNLLKLEIFQFLHFLLLAEILNCWGIVRNNVPYLYPDLANVLKIRDVTFCIGK